MFATSTLVTRYIMKIDYLDNEPVTTCSGETRPLYVPCGLKRVGVSAEWKPKLNCKGS